MRFSVPGSAGAKALEKLRKMCIGEFGSLGDLLSPLLLMLRFTHHYAVPLFSTSPRCSVSHRLQTVLLQLLLHFQEVHRDLCLAEQSFEVVVNRNLALEIIWIRNVLL